MKDLHVTLFHKNNSKTEHVENQIEEFKLNDEVDVVVKGILFVDDKNITFIIELEDKDII